MQCTASLRDAGGESPEVHGRHDASREATVRRVSPYPTRSADVANTTESCSAAPIRCGSRKRKSGAPSPTRRCRQFIAPPHFSSSSYSPRTSTSKRRAAESAISTRHERKRVDPFHSASSPIDACHDSTGSPTDATVTGTWRSTGKHSSHAPSSRPAAEAGTRIRATGWSSSSRSTPRCGGGEAYASHSTHSRPRCITTRPFSERKVTDHDSPRVASA
mmetsp:Transcript_4194/g.13835  ORF Transcript_4194/g.13835 Transcript_4194/m.13835 type:complete len:218 (-) Transcript_4194:1479-2132(-)